MLPFLAPILGSVVGAGLTAQANRQSAQDQMTFQANQSATSHQREVADLKAAGLNPILSANSGATAMSGAMGTAPDLSGPLSSGAKDAMLMGLQIKQAQANIQKTESEAKNLDLDSKKKAAEGEAYDLIKEGIQGIGKIKESLGFSAKQNQQKMYIPKGGLR